MNLQESTQKNGKKKAPSEQNGSMTSYKAEGKKKIAATGNQAFGERNKPKAFQKY